ncbi:ABC transporter ATP-binding protein [Paenibacillus sp. TRM 82003]|nr:ABC transporter ATP-binding protein [Paenibacillus sp. TRM 82003]
MAYVEMERIAYRYEGTRGGAAVDVLRDVDLRLEAGEFLCLIGRSGCGKSTLLKLAAGLLTPTEGAARLDGRALRPGPDIAFVFQRPTLLDWLTVVDNVLLPIALKRRPNEEDRAHASSLLEQVGLGELAERHPSSLSGGQQSRAALARALVAEPKLLLLDEPFASLDAITREEMQEELQRLVARRRMTAMFVTHDIGEAVYLADRVATLKDGTLAGEVSIPFARPRDAAIRFAPEFLEVSRTIRAALGKRGAAP